MEHRDEIVKSSHLAFIADRSAGPGLPLHQGIAVTGSVNQHGEIQAFGVVTPKIEGFFAICKAKGLNGEQGMIIPAANVPNLMLDEEVIDAVRAGQFHVWAVRTSTRASSCSPAIQRASVTPTGSTPRGRSTGWLRTGCGTLPSACTPSPPITARRLSKATAQPTRVPGGSQRFL
jgi:hypothetical protein